MLFGANFFFLKFDKIISLHGFGFLCGGGSVVFPWWAIPMSLSNFTFPAVYKSALIATFVLKATPVIHAVLKKNTLYSRFSNKFELSSDQFILRYSLSRIHQFSF